MKKKGKWIALACLLLILAGGVYFVQFTGAGYRMTVPYRGFDEIKKNIYVDSSYAGNKDELIAIVDEAEARVRNFWGTAKSAPLLIISDNQQTLGKLKGDHDTLVFVLFGVHSYIAISGEYLNVDIVAHELTHAELHERLYSGKPLPQTLVPTWFDEGVATQNDYREQYSDAVWREQTNSGTDVPSLDTMDTAEKFYAGTTDDRRLRYLVSRHELKEWNERNGTDALIELIEQVNREGGFSDRYFAR